MTAQGRIREWYAEEGWGVIESDATPGGCWVHYSGVLVAGYRSLQVGEDVTFVFEAAKQDGYAFRADEVWPSGQAPVRREPAFSGPTAAYTSTLTVTFDDPEGQGRLTMMRPAEDAEPARWLLEQASDWWDLVRYGPPGFEVYVRIAFAPAWDPEDPAAEESSEQLALDILAGHTSTPREAYAAIWIGWTQAAPAPPAPLVEIPDRPMVLFAGPVGALRNAPALAWRLEAYGDDGPAPHLAWPQDRAWCLACEVDEEVGFTVGCSRSAADSLAAALPGRVRIVPYGTEEPLYRDET